MVRWFLTCLEDISVNRNHLFLLNVTQVIHHLRCRSWEGRCSLNSRSSFFFFFFTYLTMLLVWIEMFLLYILLQLVTTLKRQWMNLAAPTQLEPCLWTQVKGNISHSGLADGLDIALVFKVPARSVGTARTDTRDVIESHANNAKPIFLTL